MGARFFGGKITVPTTADHLANLLADAPKGRTVFGSLAIRADRTNTDLIWRGGSDLTPTANQRGFIDAMEVYSVTLISGQAQLDSIWIVSATPNQKCYIDGVEY